MSFSIYEIKLVTNSWFVHLSNSISHNISIFKCNRFISKTWEAFHHNWKIIHKITFLLKHILYQLRTLILICQLRCRLSMQYLLPQILQICSQTWKASPHNWRPILTYHNNQLWQSNPMTWNAHIQALQNSLWLVRLRKAPYYLKIYDMAPHPHFPSEPKTLKGSHIACTDHCQFCLG